MAHQMSSKDVHVINLFLFTDDKKLLGRLYIYLDMLTAYIQ